MIRKGFLGPRILKNKIYQQYTPTKSLYIDIPLRGEQRQIDTRQKIFSLNREYSDEFKLVKKAKLSSKLSQIISLSIHIMLLADKKSCKLDLDPVLSLAVLISS